ncbi:MAG: DNA ligase [Methanophagales virus GBV301]|uniref:DNA ligase n=1 Tax=Methanophagales virus GBV301 TaxID=2999280 RepID=A0A9E8VG33_9CAUD|nr:MAG: DNA ligase [Methanophagales virus GBV301]WAE39498.1 MAG: DNA ligase [Methanophagales virus GBV301]
MSLKITFLGVNAEEKGHSCILVESRNTRVLLEPTQRVPNIDAVIITDIDKDEYSEWKYYAEQDIPIYSVAAIKRWAEDIELRDHINVIGHKFSVKDLRFLWLKANVAPHEPAGGVRIPAYDVDIVPELPSYIPQALIKAFGLPPSHIIVGIGSYKKADHKISFEDFLAQLERARSGKEKGLLSITLTNFRKDLKEHKNEVLRRLKERWDVPIFWAEKGMTLEFSKNGQVERIDGSSSSELEKLHLKEFLSKGIDYDIKHVKTRWKECIADLRYLANSAVPRLKAGKKWGEWTLDACYKYFAALVDALRSVYFALVPPTQPKLYKLEHPYKDPKEALKTSFWQTYLQAKKYMKSNPPKDEKELKEWNKKRAKIISASEEKKNMKVGYLSKAKPYLRFFLPTVHEDIESVGWDEKELLLDVKADGLRITLWKSNGKGYVFVDPEELKHKSPLINKYIPQIVREIEQILPNNTALDGELYAAKGKEALHRTVINGIINTKLPPEKFTPYAYAFAFDVLIFKGSDVRDKPLEERLKLLQTLKSSSHVKIEKPSKVVVPGHSGYVVKGNNKSAIDKAIHLIETSKHNLHKGVQEGIMIKTLDHPYEHPTNHGWAKCKLWHEVDTVVLDKKLVKGQTDVWNYHLGIEIPAEYAKMMLDDTNAYKRVRCLYEGHLYKKKECQDYLDRKGVRFFMEYGKSDNTKIKCDTGDVLRVSSEEVLYNENETHPEFPFYTGYINRAMEAVPERKTSDSLVVLHRLAMLEPKRIPLEVLAKWKEGIPSEAAKYAEYIKSLSTSRLIQFYNALRKVQSENGTN